MVSFKGLIIMYNLIIYFLFENKRLKRCLERWLEVKNSCPICLAPIKKITTQDDATLTPNCSVIVITSSNTATLDHVINNHIHPINTCQMNNNMTCSNGRNLSPVTITSILFNSNESKSCQTNDNVINIMDSANVTSNGSGRNLANDLPLPNVNNIQIFTPSQYPQQASKIINNSFSPSSSNIKSANIVYHVSTSNDLAISPEKLVSKSQNVMSFNLNDKHLLYPVLTDRQASSDVLGIRDNKYKGFYFSSSTKNNNSTTKYQKHDKGVLLMHNEDFLEAKNENSIPKNGNDFFRISSQPNFMDVYQYSEVAQSSSSPFSVSSYDFTQKLPEI
ncbi:unnamed protein product [Gordionus sp. m RMFG-2023]